MNTKPPRWLIWAGAGVLLVAFAGFAAGLALTTFRQRVAAPQVAWTPAPLARPALTLAPVARATAAPGTATVTPSATAAMTAPSGPTATLEPATDTPTPTAEVATPTPSPVACAFPVAPELAGLYATGPLGCATGDAATVWAAWEPFERGAMLWRSDADAAYAFFADGRWIEILDRWDGSEPASRGAPPVGLVAPVRGFGWAWSLRDDLFVGLGWATVAEQGFCARVQAFERGFILLSAAVTSCTPDNLYNNATAPDWRPLTLVVTAAGWFDTRPGAALPAAAAARPAAQGRFPALRLDHIVLDGLPDEWPDEWQPLTAVVAGQADWIDATDLSGMFQVAWAPVGLYLAVLVTDDVYSAGPAGTEMWQGDGLELNFDRDLAADFADPASTDDDFQIGLSYGPELAQMRAYRWLPFDQEGPLDVTGAAVTTPDGYAVEALLPWMALGVARDELTPGLTFGFNLALNDNDADEFVQQTVAASSPARTTYDNPTQWGTLVLQ